MLRRILLVAALTVFFAALAFAPLFVLGFAAGQATMDGSACIDPSSFDCRVLRFAFVALFPAGLLAAVGTATWVTGPKEPFSKYFGIATLSALALLVAATVVALFQ